MNLNGLSQETEEFLTQILPYPLFQEPNAQILDPLILTLQKVSHISPKDPLMKYHFIKNITLAHLCNKGILNHNILPQKFLIITTPFIKARLSITLARVMKTPDFLSMLLHIQNNSQLIQKIKNIPKSLSESFSHTQMKKSSFIVNLNNILEI